MELDPRTSQKEGYYALREQHIKSLERFFHELSQEGHLEVLTASELRIHLERLRRHFELFESADMLYRRESILVTNSVYVMMENRFMALMGRLNEKLEKLGRIEPGSNVNEVIGPKKQGPTVIKVEAMQPPQVGKFNGSAADWPAFRDLFIAEVHARNYDPVTKLLLLQRACVGRAAETLGPWQPTRDNYNAAWETLMRTYDDDYHVIHGILGRMNAVKKQDEENYNSLRAVLDALNGGTRQLETIASPSQLWDQFWIHYAKQRLPKNTLDSWEQHRNRDGAAHLPTLDDFKQFLEVKSKGRREFEGNDSNSVEERSRSDKFYRMKADNYDNRYKPYNKDNRIITSNHEQFVKNNWERNRPQHIKTIPQSSVNTGHCIMQGCTFKHAVENCNEFRKMSVQDRWAVVYQNRLCKCCLRQGHPAVRCRQEGCASCPDAPIKHHFRLCHKARHNAEKTVFRVPDLKENKLLLTRLGASEPQIQSVCNVVDRSLHSVLATACFRLKLGGHFSRPIRIVCDTGAQSNVIDNRVVKEFKLVRSASSTGIKGVDGRLARTKGEVNVELWHIKADRLVVRAKFVVLLDAISDQPQRSFKPEQFSFSDKDLADTQYFKQDRVDAIIGVGVLALHLKERVNRNSNGLLAQDTSFGWIVFGEGLLQDSVERSCGVGIIAKDEIKSLIQKLWEIDEICEKVLSVEDQYCEDNFERTFVKAVNRYSVTVPLKPDVELGNSRAMALRRFYCQENKFKRDPIYKKMYMEFMGEYEKLGHMRRATALNPNELHNYIPHHAVSVDRKFRVVFDGSARTTNGRSLNDVQYVGPRLQKDLMDIVMKFRTGKIAMSADICKMFRQVEIQPIHWDLQRILWRTNPNEPICDYWLTVVTYGLASSPYLAVKALQQCAVDGADEMPRASYVVRNDFYMDDMLTSVESQREAIGLKAEVIKLLKQGGFQLAKWRSNCPEIMEGEMSAKVVELQDNTSVLGILWNFVDDEFQFKVRDRNQPEVINKRFITSEAARIFDPQGWVTPVTIRAKLFIQELWRLGSSWDEPLLLTTQQQWKEFYKELKVINELRIPRWLGTTKNQSIQVHMFSDASNKAYGVAAYVRVNTGGRWKANLLCSRSRVAPIKLVTIPRLELCAVELSSKLIPKIREIPMFGAAPIYIWTDSEIVLYWLNKPINELKPFVANRISKILKEATLEQFRYVKSNQNPADLISRGMRAETLLRSNLWWQGPAMLEELRDDWPVWTPRLVNKEISSQIVF